LLTHRVPARIRRLLTGTAAAVLLAGGLAASTNTANAASGDQAYTYSNSGGSYIRQCSNPSALPNCAWIAYVPNNTRA
jgi:hypothetical protein